MLRLPTLPLALAAALFMAAPAAAQSDVAGRWEGTLETPAGNLTVVFEIEQGDDGTLSTTMYSPDQTPQPIPTGETTFEDGTLTITVPGVGGGYEGTLNDDGAVEGTWSQGPNSLPLVLSKADGGGVA